MNFTITLGSWVCDTHMEKMISSPVISSIISKLWLKLGFRRAQKLSIDEASKAINPCKLPLMCNADLDEIAVSETPGDPAFVAKYQ